MKLNRFNLIFLVLCLNGFAQDVKGCEEFDWCYLFADHCESPKHEQTMRTQCPVTCGTCNDESELSPCELLSPCNKGTCTDTDNGWYECSCPPLYSGEHCEIEECKKDYPILCHVWAEQGECCKSQNYMLEHCKVACGLCDDPPKECGNANEEPDCSDSETWCEMFTQHCQRGSIHYNTMMENCKKTCNACNVPTPHQPTVVLSEEIEKGNAIYGNLEHVNYSLSRYLELIASREIIEEDLDGDGNEEE